MTAWKVISGVLSVLMSVLVLVQSILVGFGNIISGNGQLSGAAGIVVAAALLSGGIVSVASRRGGRTGSVAMSLLFGLGALVGFVFAGDHSDLIIWSLWCLLCLFLALLDLAIQGGASDEDTPAEPEPLPEPDPPPEVERRSSIPLRLVIGETDRRKRDAMIDLLPEGEAKSYLKQVLTAFISHRPLDLEKKGGAGKVVLTVFLLLLLAAAGAAAYLYLSGRLALPALPELPEWEWHISFPP